ncbi:glycosyltransferase family protein [Mucilaginibacter xinganensis]|uniref:Uncharacterized protein n=1 Tax=Mucilaginibacter xinganensis TaxID=1234841 RepID=A0A223P4Q6_9SPHI|nr:glycosyltransferase [Mucilaginibacter xinganensis]ASU36781.1 hypothetical protein MuYL_4898 [Mucilaginibacter xinganensis]
MTLKDNPVKKKIVLVSSGQPALNPRLVKEADTLAENGYDVTVLYAYWNEWGTIIDKNLLPSKKWQAIRVGGDPVGKRLVYFFSRLITWIAALLTRKMGISYFSEFAISRNSYFLIRAAKSYQADLYIGHNLGALPAVVKAAKKYNKPCGFDAEDLHRYESSSNDKDYKVALKAGIENKYIPHVSYLTASSQQITQAYDRLFPGKTPVTLLNVFPAGAIREPVKPNTTGPVKLFWFSQVIGNSRGIEDVVKALHMLADKNFELHLLGYHSGQTTAFIDELNNGIAKIFYHEPVMPGALAEFAAEFDIGLAMEPGFSINNDFALSNKIFTYMQAGLAIVASDTTAQSALLSKYPAIGALYRKGDVGTLAALLSVFNKDRSKLLACREASLALATNTLNWENESKKFLTLITQTLDKTER